MIRFSRSALLILVSGAISAGVAGELADDLWFVEDFDRPAELDGVSVRHSLPASAFVPGRFGQGALIASEKREKSPHLTVDDPTRLAGFPWSNGTFSCWFRTPDNLLSAGRMPIFVYQKGWGQYWFFDGKSFFTGPEGVRAFHPVSKTCPELTSRTNVWMHFAATWTAERLEAYVNGRPVYRLDKPLLCDMRNVPGARFSIGGGWTWGAAQAELDEIAVFRRALTADEVARLAGATTGLRTKALRLVVSAPLRTAYARDDMSAALRFEVNAPSAAPCSIRLALGGRTVFDETRTLSAGDNLLEIPFRPADIRPGTGAWELTLSAGGRRVQRTGELTVVPGRARDDFMLLADWEGEAFQPVYGALGLNTLAAHAEKDRATDWIERNGFSLRLRVENAVAWRTQGFDFARIGEDVERLLSPYRGDALWRSTLVNSEVYGPQTAAEAIKLPEWCALARKALGFEPVVGFSASPCGIRWKDFGCGFPRGVQTNSAVYSTLEWYMRRGMPQLMMTKVDADVIRKVSPGNVVCSEPSPSPESLDQSQDWVYTYSTDLNLFYLKRSEEVPRGVGKSYLPTLSMVHYPEVRADCPNQVDPKTKKPVKAVMATTCDELKVKSWMCVGGSCADGISFFSPGCGWLASQTNGVLQETGLPLVDTPTWGRCLAEKDAIPRFGAFVRETLLPAALLLKGIPTVRAPVAFLIPQEIGYSAEFSWLQVNYMDQLGRWLSNCPIPYDVVADAGYTVENLSRYGHVLYPMLNTITPAHDRVMKALPKTTRVYTDEKFLARKELNYSNLEDIPKLGPHFPKEERYLDEPLQTWLAPKVADLRAELPAWSKEDGTNAWTFCKEYAGALYVTVVNNARRRGGCPQAQVMTNGFYRPMGAPQTITTHFNRGGFLYAFGKGLEGRVSCGEKRSVPYAAASAQVYCLYPKKLKAPEIAVEGVPVVGGEAIVRIRIADADGAPAPGRQVVRVTVTDPDGKTNDASGFYAVEKGEARVRVLFALDDPTGTFLSRWKVSVRDLTTELADSKMFRLDNHP